MWGETNSSHFTTNKEDNMTPQIRITENIEGRTFENSVFKKVTVTFEGKEVIHDCKDDFINLLHETKLEIQLEQNEEFLKVYLCEYEYDGNQQPHVFIDGIATGFNQLGRNIDFRKIVINQFCK